MSPLTDTGWFGATPCKAPDESGLHRGWDPSLTHRQMPPSAQQTDAAGGRRGRTFLGSEDHSPRAPDRGPFPPSFENAGRGRGGGCPDRAASTPATLSTIVDR